MTIKELEERAALLEHHERARREIGRTRRLLLLLTILLLSTLLWVGCRHGAAWVSQLEPTQVELTLTLTRQHSWSTLPGAP